MYGAGSENGTYGNHFNKIETRSIIRLRDAKLQRTQSESAHSDREKFSRSLHSSVRPVSKDREEVDDHFAVEDVRPIRARADGESFSLRTL